METKFFTTDDAATKALELAENLGGVAVHLNELTAAERKLYRINDYDMKKINGVEVRVFYVVQEKSADHPAHVIYGASGNQISGPTGEQIQAMIDAAVKEAVSKTSAMNADAVNAAVNAALAKIAAAPKA